MSSSIFMNNLIITNPAFSSFSMPLSHDNLNFYSPILCNSKPSPCSQRNELQYSIKPRAKPSWAESDQWWGRCEKHSSHNTSALYQTDLRADDCRLLEQRAVTIKVAGIPTVGHKHQEPHSEQSLHTCCTKKQHGKNTSQWHRFI